MAEAAAAAIRRPAWSGIIEQAAIEKVKHPDGTKTVNGFRVLRDLGSGTFAKVKLCEEESSAERFALKVFQKGRLRKQRDFIRDEVKGGMKIKTSLDKVHSEVEIMRRIVHPNCIRLYAILDEAHADGKLYLVLEYAGRGCAMDWDADRCMYCSPESGGLVPEVQAQSFVHGTLCGLSYLHEALIAHRDIKPQNLLIDADGRVKVGDFGVAIQMSEDYIVQGTEGTYYFYSPEMCRSGYKGHDGRKADVWALGVSLWAFLYGSVPFFQPDLLHLMDSIAEAKYELPARSHVSPEGQAFLRVLLASEPVDRLLPPQLLQDPWCGSPARATAQMC